MKKNGFVAPVIVLTVICLVISGLLAYVNSITSPIITEAAIKAEEEAKKEVLPEGDTFAEIEKTGDMPETLDGAFAAENGAGYVFTLTGAGYNGDVQIIVGITPDGTISGTKVLAQEETAGLGSRIEGEEFNAQFSGKGADLEGVDVISGSTISSKCFIDLVNDAFAAFELVGEGGN